MKKAIALMLVVGLCVHNVTPCIAMGSQYLSYACLGGTFVYLILYVAMFRKKKPLFAQYIFWYFFCVYMVGLLLATRVISDYGWLSGWLFCLGGIACTDGWKGSIHVENKKKNRSDSGKWSLLFWRVESVLCRY